MQSIYKGWRAEFGSYSFCLFICQHVSLILLVHRKLFTMEKHSTGGSGELLGKIVRGLVVSFLSSKVSDGNLCRGNLRSGLSSRYLYCVIHSPSLVNVNLGSCIITRTRVSRLG